MKDPTRWQNVLVQSGDTKLTKQDIYDYYTNPKIQKHLLNATGKNEVILRQSFTPENVVLRRKSEAGEPIFLRGKSDLQTWAEKRMTEVHPTFGKKTDHLLVDLDPGEDVPWKKVQETAKQVAQTLSADPRVTGVSAQFSGHRGFYVRGQLDRDMNIDAAREKVKDLLAPLVKQDKELTIGIKTDPQYQIRLDTTPLKYRGSVKAPYSLSSVTGLVAAPVRLDDLGKLKRDDFTIGRIVKKAAEIEAAHFIKEPGTKPGNMLDYNKKDRASVMKWYDAHAFRGGEQYLKDRVALEKVLRQKAVERLGAEGVQLKHPLYFTVNPDDTSSKFMPGNFADTKFPIDKSLLDKATYTAGDSFDIHRLQKKKGGTLEEHAKLYTIDEVKKNLKKLQKSMLPREMGNYIEGQLWVPYKTENGKVVPNTKEASDYDDLLEGIKTQALRAQMTRALQHYEGAKDPAHGIQHIREVVDAARQIMPETGVNPEHVLAASILHDIGREAEGPDGVDHRLTGPDLAMPYLEGLDPIAQRNIRHAIRQHGTSGHPRTLLAKLVRDADKLPGKIDPGVTLRRLVEYRRAHNPELSDAEIPEESRQYILHIRDKQSPDRLPSLLTPKAIELAAPRQKEWEELKHDPVKWEAAIKPYMEVKEAAAKKYRDRVEAFALTPDGKVIAGLYPAESRIKTNVAVPGGGVDPGETKNQAAKREFKEEAGIAIKNVRSLGVAPVLTAWSHKDKSYKGKDWQAEIKKHPSGNRTHFVLADVDSAKSKTTPRDPTEFHKTLKARPIDDLIAVQRKAIRTQTSSDRLKQMRKRLEMLLKIKHTEKTAFEIPADFVMGLFSTAGIIGKKLHLQNAVNPTMHQPKLPTPAEIPGIKPVKSLALKRQGLTKNAFDYEGLLRVADVLDDKLWIYLWKKHQQEQQQSREVPIGAPHSSMVPEPVPANYAAPPPFAEEPRSMFRKESAKKEFAPGIPLSRKIHNVPNVKNKAWTLAIQRHYADRAGKHFDLRLVDPKTHKAHSFALPKAELPKPGQMRLAVQQATHTEDYAMNFEGTIPKGTYGSGKVEMALKTPVDIIKSNANHIAFKTEKGDQYTMFRMKDKNWGIKNTTK